MAENVDTMKQQLTGVQDILTQLLDKVNSIDAWKSTAESSLGTLLKQSASAAERIGHLEARPPPPPPPNTTRPQPQWVNPFDLNLAPPDSSRPPATTSERPHGHRLNNNHRDDGGGILGAHPPHPVTSMFPEHHSSAPESPWGGHPHAPYPKLEFPKFDGDNPRLWRDRCEMYFEVYSVADALKTRFAALNFIGAAATWLQTFKHRGRVLDWD
ncbi:hypothetical protein BS78_08G147400 [Paspalum vaginatum]|nr:hypothetical protein BS78_08G147400 [Paspalum vaginatum]